MRFPLVIRLVAATLLIALAAGPAVAGPFNVAGIPASDPRFVVWANGVSDLTRGPVNLANPGLGLASFGSGSAALGVANNGVVSLGDGGSITLTFANPITNGAGADFAVFENGFGSGSGLFAELGHVEVSSDGVNFVRFPSVSLTQTNTQVGGFGAIDPTDVNNLAGRHPALFGTPFDLAELIGVSALLDVNRVTHVRIVDVVGSINPSFGSRDSQGRLINDPYSTPFASGGFDLDAVGVINQTVPEPVVVILFAAGVGAAIAQRVRRSRAA